MYSIKKQKIKKITNIKRDRFLLIVKLKDSVFHVSDLARIWGIDNSQTLSAILRRYADSGLIYRLYRGFYSIKPLSELDPWLLGARVINSHCYLSGETILAKHGIIFQQVYYFTFISDKNRRFKIGDNNYYCRQLKKEFLYNDIGIDKKGKFNLATLERAVADILYFNPRYYFDNPNKINWTKVRKIQATVYNIKQ